MAATNWRTINIDAFDPDSAANFDIHSLVPADSVPPVSASEIQSISGQIRQLLRGGDTEGALRGALENAPYGGDQAAKETHLATVVETLQSIKASDMSPLISRIYASDNGPETLDVLMKYLYKGMAQTASPSPSAAASSTAGARAMTPQATGFSQIGGGGRGLLGGGGGAEGGGQAMSVLLSWHEKLVEIAGLGGVVRVMTDRRTV